MVRTFREKLGPKLYAQLEEALVCGSSTHSVEDLIPILLRGEAQLLVGERSLVLTEINEHPRKRVLHVWCAAGDLDELFTIMLARVEAFARANDCDHLTLVGRMGWLREAKKIGFTETHIAMNKDLRA